MRRLLPALTAAARRALLLLPLLCVMATSAYGQNVLQTQPAPAVIATITTPEKFFGFQMGADRKMARWDKMVDYYNLLAKQSPRVKVVNMGPTADGQPLPRGVHLLAGEPRPARDAARVEPQAGRSARRARGGDPPHRARRARRSCCSP